MGEPAWPGEPTLSIAVWGPTGDPRHAYYKARIFSFPGMLSVRYLLYIYIIKNGNKVPSLGKYQNKIPNLTICKIEFRGNILFAYNLA